jgi:hypothetical protein
MPAPTPPSIKFDPSSPFSTPRKKFRATTTHDIGSLMTPGGHKHSPAASSPLRSTEVTPRVRLDDTPRAAPREEGIIGDPQTPSRRSARAAAKMREREGAAAFLAMRPRQPEFTPKEKETEAEREESGPALARRDLDAEIDGVLGRRTRRRLRPRRDWTFREAVWAPDREGMARVLAAVDATDKGKGKGGDFGAQLAALLA